MDSYLRVALAQISFWPAYYDRDGERLRAFPGERQTSTENEALAETIKRLRIAQIRLKLDAVIAECERQHVKLLVLPEYSVPAELLSFVRQRAKGIYVVAGSHLAKRTNSDIFKNLPLGVPRAGTAIAPVFFNGQLMGYQSKLSLSPRERDTGTQVLVGEGRHEFLIQGIKSAVMICVDFLASDGGASGGVTSPADPDLIIVPALTEADSVADFQSVAVAHSRRHHRFVVFCNHADGGGSTIWADHFIKGTHRPLSLKRDEEGLLLADINVLTYRGGASKPLNAEPPIRNMWATPIRYDTVTDDRYLISIIRQAHAALPRSDDVPLNVNDLGALSLRFEARQASHSMSVLHVLNTLRQGARGDISDIATLQREISIVALGAPCLRKDIFDLGLEVALLGRPQSDLQMLGHDEAKHALAVFSEVPALRPWTAPQRIAETGARAPRGAALEVAIRLRHLVEERPFAWVDDAFSLPQYPKELSELSPEEQAASRYYLEAVDIITGNPNDIVRRQAYESAFTTPILPGSQADPIEAVISSLEARGTTTLLTGPRGSGKSTLVNYIVTAQIEKLRERRICWFRSDLHKLYEILTSSQIKADITQYQAIHTLWVCMLYCGNHPDIGREPALEPLAKYFATPHRHDLIEDNVVVRQLVNKCMQLALELNAFKPHLGSKDLSRTFVTEVLGWLAEHVRFQARRRELCLAIVRAIHRELLDNKWVVAHILDSADNVAAPILATSFCAGGAASPEELIYDEMLRDVVTHVCRDSDTLGYDSLLVCLRDGTWEDLKAVERGSARRTAPRAVHGRSLQDVNRLELSPVDASRVIEQKLLNANAPYLKEVEPTNYWARLASRYQTPAAMKPLGRERALLMDHVQRNHFAPNAVRLIQRFLPKEQTDKERTNATAEGHVALALESVFDGNMRSFIRNTVQTCLYCARRFKRHRNSAPSRDNMQRFFQRRGYLASEGSLLGGGYVFPEQEEHNRSSLRGEWCPALFFGYPVDGKATYWPGFPLFRVLQAIDGAHSTRAAKIRTPSAILQAVAEMFGYSQQKVDAALKRAFSYSLVERTPEALVTGHNNDVVSTLRLTLKGKLVISLAFEVPEVTYHMALRAPYSTTIWRQGELQDSRLFECHVFVDKAGRVQGGRWHSSLVRTSITFLRHVYHFHRREMDRMRDTGATVADRFGVGIGQLEAWFALPDLSRWYKALAAQLVREDIDRTGALVERSRIRLLEELETIIPETIIH